MKVTSKRAYQVVKAMLELRTFTQYRISKKEGIAFSVVNRVVNWFVSQGFVAKRQGHYEVTSPAGIIGVFPLYRRLKPVESFDVELKPGEVLDLMKGKGVLCLTTALAHYDSYFRDPAIHFYIHDEEILGRLRTARKGYTKLFAYRQDLATDNAVRKDGQLVTDEVRTIIDLFCNGKAYAAERLVKRKWLK